MLIYLDSTLIADLIFAYFSLNYYYPRRQIWLAWVECSAPSVCLFVRSITQKRIIPKCSNLVQESWDSLEMT